MLCRSSFAWFSRGVHARSSDFQETLHLLQGVPSLQKYSDEYSAFDINFALGSVTHNYYIFLLIYYESEFIGWFPSKALLLAFSLPESLAISNFNATRLKSLFSVERHAKGRL